MTGGPDSADRARQLHELVDAIDVMASGVDTFVGVTPDWWGERVFGGMVVAQSLSAACKTVHGLQPHSLHSYFFRPVRPGPPTTLTVDRVRDSRSFSTRQITAEQDGRTTSRLLCSFHTPETGEEYQLPMPDVPGPEDVPDTENPPGPYEVRDLGPLPGRDGTFVSSGRFWLRTCAPLPDDDDIHHCVASFFSDMTRTSFRPLSLHAWGAHTDASIDHAMWFHRPVRPDEWLFYDLTAVVNTAGRSTVRGVMYAQDGMLCASVAQELLIRPLPGPGVRPPWLSPDDPPTEDPHV